MTDLGHFVEEARTHDPQVLWSLLSPDLLPHLSIWSLMVDKMLSASAPNRDTSVQLQMLLDLFNDVLEKVKSIITSHCEVAIKEEEENEPPSSIISLGDMTSQLFGYSRLKLSANHEALDGRLDWLLEGSPEVQDDHLQSDFIPEDFGNVEMIFSEKSVKEKKPKRKGKRKRFQYGRPKKRHQSTKTIVNPVVYPVECSDCKHKSADRENWTYHRKTCLGSNRLASYHRSHGDQFYCTHLDCLPHKAKFNEEETVMFYSKEDVFKHGMATHFKDLEFVHGCTECPEKFPFPNMLHHHITIHHGRKYTCPTCGLVVADGKKHELVHQLEKPLKCDECDLRFKRRSCLNRHKITIHTKEKTHVCHQCGKEFFAVYGLKEHMFTHSDIRRYKCKLCGRELKNDSCYRRHMVGVHGVKVTCDLCGKDFSTSRGCKIHKREVHGVTL